MKIKDTLAALRRFRRNTDGTTSIEFVLWFPFFLALQALIADSSLAFLNVNRIYDAARDVGRRASVGEMTAAQAAIYVKTTLPDFIKPTVSVDDSSATDLVVNISTPISNLSFFGLYDGLKLGTLNVSYTVRKEIS